MKNDNVKYSVEIANEFLKWQTYSCFMWISLALIMIILSYLFIGYSKRNFCNKNNSMLESSQAIFCILAFIGLCVISFFSYELVHIITAPNHYLIDNLYCN